MTGFFKDLNDEGGGRRKKKDPARITLSEDEKEVLSQLKRLTWPKGSGRYLPAAVRSSMRNYNRFLIRFKKVLKASKKKFPDGMEKHKSHLRYNDLHEFVQHKLTHAFQPAPTYISCWFETLHQKVSHWKQWNGKIRPFTIQSKEFQNEGYDLATEFGGNSDADLWKKFMQLIEGDE